MSLPLPVFRLDTHGDLPYEPLCAIQARDASVGARTDEGWLSRLQAWFAAARGTRPVTGSR